MQTSWLCRPVLQTQCLFVLVHKVPILLTRMSLGITVDALPIDRERCGRNGSVVRHIADLSISEPWITFLLNVRSLSLRSTCYLDECGFSGKHHSVNSSLQHRSKSPG